ncbi:MAG: cell division protein FtsQ/DivIB [Chitinophagales bacterium]|nr:cell division protein FtsQ/DivIB [Chitinophagales bacterium]
MSRKLKNIVFKSFMLLSFGAFIVLTIMSFRHGQSQINTQNAFVDIDYGNGQAFVSKEIVRDSINKFFSKDKSFDYENLSKLESFLKSYPYIRKANAYIDAQSILHVSIEQIVPIARVVPVNGDGYYIDIDNNKIPLSTAYTAKVPILTGAIKEQYQKVSKIQSKELKSLIKVIEDVKGDEYWSAQIAQLNMTDEGDIQMIPRMGHHSVTLGDSSEIMEKLQKLDLFYEKVLNKTGWDKFKNIDVQYKNQIVCK